MPEVTLEVLDPTGAVVVKGKALASRVDTLEGKTIGLVWNLKPGGEVFLDEVGKLLGERYPTARLSHLTVSDCCVKLPPGELEAIAKDIDLAVFTSAD